MDQKAFDDFLHHRYKSKLNHYRRRALYHQSFYIRIQWSIFIFSALTTVLVALQSFFDEIPIKWLIAFFKILIVLFSVIVSTLAGIFKFFNYQEKWAFYNKIILDLETEYDMYIAKSSGYSQAGDKESLFVTRVSEMLKKAMENMPNQTVTKSEHTSITRKQSNRISRSRFSNLQKSVVHSHQTENEIVDKPTL